MDKPGIGRVPRFAGGWRGTKNGGPTEGHCYPGIWQAGSKNIRWKGSSLRLDAVIDRSKCG